MLSKPFAQTTVHNGMYHKLEKGLTPETHSQERNHGQTMEPAKKDKAAASLVASSEEYKAEIMAFTSTAGMSTKKLMSDLNNRVDSLESVAEVKYLVRQAIERARRRKQKRQGGTVWMTVRPKVLVQSIVMYSAASASVDAFCYDPLMVFLGIEEPSTKPTKSRTSINPNAFQGVRPLPLKRYQPSKTAQWYRAQSVSKGKSFTCIRYSATTL